MTAPTKPDGRTGEMRATGVDRSWRRLYAAGGVCAFGYILLAIIVPGVLALVADYDFTLTGAELLELIGDNRLWWMVLQGTVLESSILAIITFVALFAALRHLDRSWAAIGAVVAVVSLVLYMAYYPVLLGLTYLSDQWVDAAAGRQAELAAAAEALIAQNNAFNPVYEPLTAAGVLFLSVVMRNGVFSRWVAWLGIATFVAALAGVALHPVLGLAYLWWWAFFTAWFLAVGWQLWRFGHGPQEQQA